VPVEQPAPQPVAPVSAPALPAKVRLPHQTRSFWIGAGVLVLAFTGTGVCIAVTPHGSSAQDGANAGAKSAVATQALTEAPTSTPLPTATAKPTATPTATPATPPPTLSQRELAASYAKAIQADTAAASSGFNDVQTACSAGDFAGCRSALVSLQTNLAIFQQDLDAHPAPPCLKAADQELRQALSLYQQGAQLGVQGIDQVDAAKISQGGDLMSQATAHLTHASALVQQASC